MALSTEERTRLGQLERKAAAARRDGLRLPALSSPKRRQEAAQQQQTAQQQQAAQQQQVATQGGAEGAGARNVSVRTMEGLRSLSGGLRGLSKGGRGLPNRIAIQRTAPLRQQPDPSPICASATHSAAVPRDSSENPTPPRPGGGVSAPRDGPTPPLQRKQTRRFSLAPGMASRREWELHKWEWDEAIAESLF